jgi:5-methylcytosine-specific restriction enzyme B
MAIPQVDREAILAALAEFDRTHRASDEFANWESNLSHLWGVEHEGKLYPPKKVLSIATGAPVNSFSGGPEANTYLNARGFETRRLRNASLRDAFASILERYPTLRSAQSFGGNTEARELFGQARAILQSWIDPEKREYLQLVASYGKGNWATIPWISILDVRETKTTQDGTYVVYLFREDGQGINIKLAQGVTKVEDEFGARAFSVLEERAAKLRPACADLADLGWDTSGKSELAATNRLGRLYEASTIAAKYYARDSIPSDGELQEDLFALLKKYEEYVARRVKEKGKAIDSRRVSLIGTWRSIDQEIPRIREAVEKHGGWASWWSFPIKEEAQQRLQPPFSLYAYQGDGKVAARLRVDEMSTSRGSTGIETPWPDLTEPEWRGKTKLSNRQSETFKTWLRIGAVERLSPPRSIDEFEIAFGLSTSESVLNQNTFGYVIEDESLTQVTSQEPSLVKAVPKEREDLQALVDRTGLPRPLLAEMVEALLGPSPQILVAGPPGTSKTWLARELALYVAAGQPEQTRFVQFHANYSYESFIEGLRPVTRDGGVHFELTPGLVVETVREMRHKGAADQVGIDYVIVMDEANRANLPRVLGELMFAFEYRDQTVRLQYSGEFALPGNLRFIGTMNTADRSIRSIDIALRRRFEVFELAPDADLLGRYHAKMDGLAVPSLVDGFVELNQRLSADLDRHHTIGHAFFMRPNLSGIDLQRIWQRRVFPLIEEFFFDQPDLLKEYSLERFWPGLQLSNA